MSSLIRSAIISILLHFACLHAKASDEAETQYRKGLSHDMGSGMDKDRVVAAERGGEASAPPRGGGRTAAQ
jgi:hypothetical protein